MNLDVNTLLRRLIGFKGAEILADEFLGSRRNFLLCEGLLGVLTNLSDLAK